MDAKNKLYFGDDLEILRAYVASASVDLIYLDPPFNSMATYNVCVAPPFRAADAGLPRPDGPVPTGSREVSGKPAATSDREESAVRPCPPPRACRGAAQIMAFEDTWQWSEEAEAAYKEIVTSGRLKLAGRSGSWQGLVRSKFDLVVRWSAGQ